MSYTQRRDPVPDYLKESLGEAVHKLVSWFWCSGPGSVDFLHAIYSAFLNKILLILYCDWQGSFRDTSLLTVERIRSNKKLLLC